MAGKALFLDRDGVVNVDGGYVHRIEDFRLVPGILNLCCQAKEKGYLVLVATFGFVLLTTDVAIGRRTKENALRRLERCIRSGSLSDT